MIKFVSHPSITQITSYILQSLFPGHWRHGDSGWEEAKRMTVWSKYDNDWTTFYYFRNIFFDHVIDFLQRLNRVFLKFEPTKQ